MKPTKLQKTKTECEKLSLEITVAIDAYYGNGTGASGKTLDLTDEIMRINRNFIQSIREEAKKEGAERARDWMILAGVEIDGVDYIKLEDALSRYDECISSLTEDRREK